MMNKDKNISISKLLIHSAFLICVLMIAPTAYAQQTDDIDISGVMKVSGVSPMVGTNFNFGGGNTIRTLGFFSANSSGINDSFVLDLSYLRNFNLSDVESLDTYWGINLHLQFDDTVIGPGALFGTSYSMSKHFAIFGEAGLNVFIVDDSSFRSFGMINSGLGIEVSW